MTRRRLSVATAVLGVLGLTVTTVGWAISPRAFYGAWLAAYLALLAWPLGSIALLLIHSLTGGKWGEGLRPALLAGVCLMPLLAPAAVPLLFGLSDLFPWLRPGAELPNRFYLNGHFFAVRAGCYAAIWLSLAALIVRAHRRPDSAANLAALAPIGLILLGLTGTFAAVDLIQSLEPGFNSSVFGMLQCTSIVLLALAVAVLVQTAAVPAERISTDAGRLLLGLVILWAYLSFVEALIVWESDLTAEIPWYFRRTNGGWGIVALILACGHFALPFACLLGARWQSRRRLVAGVGALLVAMEILRIWWLVLPDVPGGFTWIAPAAVLGLGAGTAGLFLRLWNPDGVAIDAFASPRDVISHG